MSAPFACAGESRKMVCGLSAPLIYRALIAGGLRQVRVGKEWARKTAGRERVNY